MRKLVPVISVLVLLFIACKKGPGEGGNSSILGKVWVEEWNSSFTVHNSANDHAGMDEDVYIIYGDDATYGDRVKSGPDGVFEFKYLRPGNYTIYVYTDSSQPGGKTAIKKTVEIPGKGQTVDAGVFTIFN